MTDRHAWAAAAVAAKPGERLLEVGCGAGQAAQLVLADLGPDGSLLAIDRSATAITAARSRNADALDAGRVQTEVTGLDELAGFDDEFDGAWALNVNVFWTRDPTRELQALARVLRPGARLLLLWDAGPTGAAKLAPVVGRLASAGFTGAEQVGSAAGVIIRARAPKRGPKGAGAR